MHPDAGPARAEVGAYLLAGGRSLRMGRDKHRLVWAGASMVQHLAAMAAPLVAHVWLVGKRDGGLEDHGLPMIHDASAEPALVHGIRAALQAPGPEWRWLLACDMPAVTGDVLGALWRTAHAAAALGAAPALSPAAELEPLPSLWHRDAARCVPDAGVEAARAWMQRVGFARWVVPVDHRACLANLNTAEEWDAWRSQHDEPRA